MKSIGSSPTAFPLYVRYSLVFLVFAVPLAMYAKTSELFEFNKMMIIYVTAIFVGALSVLGLLKHGTYAKVPRLLGISIMLFLGSQILSTLFSIDIQTSLSGYYGRFNGGLYSIIAYLVLFYGALIYGSRDFIERLLKVSLGAAVAVAIWGLPGVFGHDISCWVFTGQFDVACWTDQFRPMERMFSTLGQPNWLGAYLGIHIAFSLYFALRGFMRKDRSSYIYSFMTTLLFVCVLLTRSRSALLATGIVFGMFGLSVMFIAKKHRIFRSIWKELGGLGLVLILAVFVIKTGVPQIDSLLSFRSTTTVSDTVSEPTKTQIGGATESFDIRKIVWKGAVDLGNKHPLVGTGVETFAYAYYNTRPAAHNLTSEWDFLYNKAHNEFLNYFATTGYIGLGAYLFMITAVYVTIIRLIICKYKSDNPEAAVFGIAIAGGYTVIQVTNFFGFSTTSVQLFMYLIPACAILFTSEEPATSHAKILSPMKRKIAVYLVVIAAGYLFLRVGAQYRADLKYAYADRLVSAGHYQEAAEEYSEVLSLYNHHLFEDKVSYVLANLAFGLAHTGNSESSDRVLALSQFYNTHARSRSRGNILYLKTAMKNAFLYYQINQNPSYLLAALPVFGEAAEVAPTDPKIPYSEALFHSLLSDEAASKEEARTHSEQAVARIDRAIELKPNYYDAYLLKAQLLAKSGKKAEAKKVYEFMLSTFNSEDAQVREEMSIL